MTANPMSRQVTFTLAFRLAASLAAVLVAACTSGPAALPAPTSTTVATATATSTREPSPTRAPTTRPANPTPTAPATPTQAASPTPIAWPDPIVNDDGSVWIARPSSLVAPLAGDDAMWTILHQRPGGTSIVRVDPQTNKLTTVVQGLLRLPNPIHGMAVNGSIWITSWDKGNVEQFDAETGESIQELPLGNHVIEPVYAFGDIWTLNHHANSVSRVDVETGEVAATIPLDPPGRPLWMTATDDMVWVVGVTSSLYGISPETNELSLVYDTGLECLVHVTTVGERMLLRSCESGAQFWDPRTGELAEVADPRICCGPGLEVDGKLWLVRGAEGDWVDGLVAVDPETGEVVDEFDLPERFPETGIEAAFDSIWVGSTNGLLRVPVETLNR